MTKFMKAALASSVLVASVMGANAANAATATADAKANILQQVTVASDGSDLDFGTIVSGASAATVAINAAGAANCSAGIVCSGTTSAAGFDVTGTNGETVDISTDTTVLLTGPTDTMTASLTPSVTSMVLGGGDAFTVGGTLNVGAGQDDGAYVGNFTVTVSYQ